jgi:hypothetical protein
MSWYSGIRWNEGLYAAGAALALALFVGSLGYWIGRASAPGEPEQAMAQQEPAAIASAAVQPDATPLPPPPVAMNTPVAQPTAPAPAPHIVLPPPDPARVVIRAKPALPTALPGQPVPAAAAPLVPGAQSPTSFPTYRLAPAPTPVVVQRSETPPVAPMPEPSTLVLRPTDSSAVVNLKNDTTSPVRVTLDGNGSRTATVGAGSTFPIRLSPGAYQLRANGSGMSTGTTTLAIGAGVSYTLVISRQQEQGRETLVLVEPELVKGG